MNLQFRRSENKQILQIKGKEEKNKARKNTGK